MDISIDEFVNSVKNGHEGPNLPCQRRNMRGDQVFQIPFTSVCNGLCKKHNMYPLSLYTMMQQGICDDMVRRSQRSSLFRNLIQKVSDDWGYSDTFLPDIFQCNNVSFEEDNLQNESDLLESLFSQYNGVESELENDIENENDMYDKIMILRSDADNSLDRNRKYLQDLEMNQSYDNPNIRIWSDLSTYMKPDYLESFEEDSNDSNMIRYANKKVNKEIPDEMPQIFTNLSLLETLKLKKCEELKRELYSNIEQLQELLKNCDSTLAVLPQPVEKDSKPWVWKMLGIGGDVSENESDEEYSGEEEEDPAVELRQALEKLEDGTSSGDIVVTDADEETVPDEEYKLELNIDDENIPDEEDESINPMSHQKNKLEFF